jgi:outer membrane biosynthesis protein TonB
MTSKSTKLVLKTNKKLGKIYHPDTGLVFKSATEKVVIGRIVDDEFVSLDDEAVELCEQNHFKIDESLLESEEAEEQPSEKKSSKKKKSDEEEEKADEEEEEEAPKAKTAKAPKKSEEPAKEPVKEPAKEPVKEAKPAKNKPADSSDGFSAMLSRHAKEMQEYVAGLQSEAQTDKDRVAELEKQLATTKKELEEVRKKLKGVLSAMQGEL